jgi:coproporphyrinogen III oxidase-like Fe-S oxidoreductase
MYELIVDGLSDLYRMSSCWSFSRADESTIDEYITQTDDYAGLGSGSFGYIDGLFYANTFSIPEYIRAVGRGEFPIIVSKRFSLGERIRYNSLMSLFNGRVDPADAARRFGVLSLLHLWREVPLMAVAGGMRPAGRFLRLTERGRFLSMLMMKEFFSAVSEFREVCRSLSIAKQIAK